MKVIRHILLPILSVLIVLLIISVGAYAQTHGATPHEYDLKQGDNLTYQGEVTYVKESAPHSGKVEVRYLISIEVLQVGEHAGNKLAATRIRLEALDLVVATTETKQNVSFKSELPVSKSGIPEIDAYGAVAGKSLVGLWDFKKGFDFEIADAKEGKGAFFDALKTSGMDVNSNPGGARAFIRTLELMFRMIAPPLQALDTHSRRFREKDVYLEFFRPKLPGFELEGESTLRGEEKCGDRKCLRAEHRFKCEAPATINGRPVEENLGSGNYLYDLERKLILNARLEHSLRLGAGSDPGDQLRLEITSTLVSEKRAEK